MIDVRRLADGWSPMDQRGWLFAAVAYIRVAASRAGVPVPQACQT